MPDYVDTDAMTDEEWAEYVAQNEGLEEDPTFNDLRAQVQSQVASDGG